MDLPLFKPFHQPAQLDVDDLLHVLAVERVEDDDLVDAVDEFGPEVCPHDVHRVGVALAEIRRHDDDGVLEVDRAALAVGQPTVVQQLQQDVEHFGMRLFDLVEQHDRVGPAPHRFGELTGLVVADVARRRTDQARHGVLLLVLGHVDADHRLLVVEQELGQRACQLGLADAGRTQEEEAAERPIRILQSGAGAPNRVRHRLDRFVLADDALVQPLFHLEQLLDFAFHQAAHRNARPVADDFGDVFLVDFFLEHPLACLQIVPGVASSSLNLLLELAACAPYCSSDALA